MKPKYIKNHPWNGKIIKVNEDVCTLFWKTHHYIDYLFEVIGVVNSADGPLLHTKVHTLLPGRKGSRDIDRMDGVRDKMHIHMADTLLTESISINNSVMSYILEDDY